MTTLNKILNCFGGLQVQFPDSFACFLKTELAVEVLHQAVLRGRQIRADERLDLHRLCPLDQPVERPKLDASAECPTTQKPRVDLERVALFAADEDRDQAIIAQP